MSSDTPSRRSDADTKYGALSDVIDHPTVWDDWSGGYGLAYRRSGEDRYHWAENFDARFPRQLIHCQKPRLAQPAAANATLGWLEKAETVFDVNLWRGNQGVAVAGHHGICVLDALIGAMTDASNWIAVDGKVDRSGASWHALHPAALYGSLYYIGHTMGSTFLRLYPDASAEIAS